MNFEAQNARRLVPKENLQNWLFTFYILKLTWRTLTENAFKNHWYLPVIRNRIRSQEHQNRRNKFQDFSFYKL